MSYSINNIIFISSDGNIGIGTSHPRCSLDLSQRTDAIALPNGTTDQRLGLTNVLRFNRATNFMEFRKNNNWLSIVNVPSITAVYPNVLKNANDIIDVSGVNFSSISQWSFVDNANKEYPPKQVIYINSTHIQLKRPDVFPVFSAPYSVKVKQFGRFSLYGSITAGVIPTISPGSGSLGTFLHNYNINGIVITATDESGGGITNISITSGVLPPGLSAIFTSDGMTGTYTISGTPNTVASTTTYSFSLTATDAGYNTITQNYSITIFKEFITGGTTLDYGIYHVRRFTTTGTLTVTSPIKIDLLLIGGGGGGGYGSDRTGGGGGAGGLVYDTNYLLTPGTYSYTIGNGGPNTTNGEDSVFETHTAYGGGHGANSVYTYGGYGGSGGGAFHGTSYPGDGISSNVTPELGLNYPGVYGNGGGDIGYNSGVANGYFRGSGGGGAGTAGTTATSSVPGHGGNGLQISITGTTRYYAAGGGGSAQSLNGQNAAAGNGGLGGGGAGAKATSTTAVNGSNATGYGGGGGGGASGGAGGAGFQGVFILRYKVVGPTITSPERSVIWYPRTYSPTFTFTATANSPVTWSNAPTTFGTINPTTGTLTLDFTSGFTDIYVNNIQGNITVTATESALGLTDSQTIAYSIY
jgi:hypothetical protein